MSTRYHRLARETPAYAWWRLPVAGLLALVLYIGLTLVLIAAAFFAIAPVRGSRGVGDWLDAAGDLDLARPDFFVLDMLGLAILIPAVLAAVWVTGPRPVGYLSSVTGRLRWGWLGRNAAMSALVFTVVIGGSVVVDAVKGSSDVAAPGVDGRVALAIVLVLLVTPLQAGAEEYVFRGYVLQLVGSWTRFATIPVIVSVPLFVSGHTYDFWGLVDVGLFGLTAAILTIRSGGLEAAIAAHTANNVVLFVLDALGVVVATDDTGAGPLDLIPTVLAGITIVLWVEWEVRRRGIQRTRDPIPVPPPPPPPPPVWQQPWVAPPYAGAPYPQLHATTPGYPGAMR